MNLQTLFRTAICFLNPRGFYAAMNRKPFSVTAFFLLRAVRENGGYFEFIIDGGANIGQFARAAVETYPDARIIAFEPLPEVAEKFMENLKNRSNQVRLIQSALGRKPGKTSFHRNSHSHSSSVLPLHENHRNAFPSAKDVSVLTVPVTTLDAALKREKITGPALLKLDLQGFELEALRGAVQTLKRVDAVLVEVSLKPMYKGEPSFKEVEKFLKTKGFYFSKNLDLLKDDKGNVLQADSFYLKK